MTVLAVLFALLAALPAQPNFAVTPGVARPLTKIQVCATAWGKDARHVTAAMKKQVAENYGLEPDRIVGYGKGPCCEYDHLISRELGGADDVKNLWPQPWVDAKKKDALENSLHRDVCVGTITLGDAQKRIVNWGR